MPGPVLPREHEPFAELAAGYALYALDDDDRELFESHLAGCATCAAAVAAHEDIAVAAFRIDDEPPAGLREAILDGAGGARGEVVDIRSRRPPRAPWLVSAAAAAAVIALTVTNVALRQDLNTSRAALEQTSAVVHCAATPSCRTIGLADSQRSATGVALVEGGRVTLIVDKLPVNDRARETYVLWQRTPSGTLRALRAFDVRRSAVTVIYASILPGADPAAASFAVSIEQGREAPTVPTRPVLTPVA